MSRPLVALALLLATVANASEAQTWQPTGKWTVDDTETGCILSREFSADGIGLTLKYEPWFSSPGAKIVVLSTDPTFPRRGRVIVTLLPSNRSFDFDPPPGPIVDKSEGLTGSSAGPDVSAALARATSVRIAVSGRTIDLATGSFAAANAALDQCRDNRLRGYGLDPTTVIQLPVEQMTPIYSYQDYPADAVRDGIQGRSMVAVSFGADGKPATCKIVESSGNASLDSASCRPGFRLKLDPVGDGSKIRWVVFPVRYVLPGSRR